MVWRLKTGVPCLGFSKRSNHHLRRNHSPHYRLKVRSQLRTTRSFEVNKGHSRSFTMIQKFNCIFRITFTVTSTIIVIHFFCHSNFTIENNEEKSNRKKITLLLLPRHQRILHLHYCFHHLLLHLLQAHRLHSIPNILHILT